MSAEFWAGYLSGVAGIIIGNPLDVIKVRLQASRPGHIPRSPHHHVPRPTNFFTGTTAPILGYGALNALLFVTYNRAAAFLHPHSRETPTHLHTIFVAGGLAGLATCPISTPTELLKCRAQLAASPTAPFSCWRIAQSILYTQGLRGLYCGARITACRDAIGYAFYFWSYEVASRMMPTVSPESRTRPATASILICGGAAGVVSWTSVFPLDAIKTRVQTHVVSSDPADRAQGLRVRDVVRTVYRNEGAKFFFRGWTVCSMRAFLVNAVQWAAYEWVEDKINQRGLLSKGC
ncbi:hypothetical protein K3495_g6563 [Podosphaera aphanis]|nr:hypothetical protein K3495_g6563 [Podosphaera aphanis]